MVVASPVLWLPCEHQGTKLGDSMTLEGILRRILRRILRLGDRMPKPRSMQDTGCRILCHGLLCEHALSRKDHRRSCAE